ncbi:MAG: hypothetical protein GF344_08590, partial [Chitinivibrionales bacterium]|nr:hypothetical protein [Chitinivibrionales bacterium]
FDFEVAGSIVKPTSGDEAYVDDFEGSRQELALGEDHDGVNHNDHWHEASPPYDDSVLAATSEASVEDDLAFWRPPAWHWYWIKPELRSGEATEWDSIWTRRPGEETVTQQTEKYASTLRLIVYPFPDDTGLLEGVADTDGKPLVNPWAGIVRPIPPAFKDREDDKYFEFWVNDYGTGGTLHIDIGEIAEDLSLDGRMPNKVPDTERRNHDRDFYDRDLDLGLDSLADEEERYYYPDFSGSGWRWTELEYGDMRLGDFAEDPARDNWIEYDITDDKNLSAMERKFANGTQGDEELSSEALSYDGFNLYRDNFYRASLDLASLTASPYLDQPGNAAEGTGWYRVRIPIKGDHWKSVGRPDWSEVKAVRVWWSDFADTLSTSARTLEFTGMKFVGNQWVPVDTSDTTGIEAASRNSEDDKDIYETPPEIRRRLEKRNEGGVERREQALSLKYWNLHEGEVELVERFFGEWEKINLAAYDDMRMYIRGFSTQKAPKIEVRKVVDTATGNVVEVVDTIGESTVFGPMDPNTWFVVRFGNDDSTYYEYRTKNIVAQTGADVEKKYLWQELSINLKELSELKREYFERYGDTVSAIDTLYMRNSNSAYGVFSRTKVMPTFSNVEWLALGVMRDESAIGADSGEIWIEGIRVAGLKARKGMAFTAGINTQWADFMTFNANVSYKNADFRSMSEDFMPERPTTLSGGLSANWTLDKFLPSQWGVAIPFGVQVSSEMMRPKIKTGSDIYLTDTASGEPDGFSEMGRDFASMVLGKDLGGDTT